MEIEINLGIRRVWWGWRIYKMVVCNHPACAERHLRRGDAVAKGVRLKRVLDKAYGRVRAEEYARLMREASEALGG